MEYSIPQSQITEAECENAQVKFDYEVSEPVSLAQRHATVPLILLAVEHLPPFCSHDCIYFWIHDVIPKRRVERKQNADDVLVRKHRHIFEMLQDLVWTPAVAVVIGVALDLGTAGGGWSVP
jgi:hypothetical protein